MKRRANQILSLVLAAVLTAGLCFTAMAGDEAPAYTKYVSLGDSLSAGFSQELYPISYDTLLDTTGIAPCWTVAEELGGIDYIYTATFSGARSSELLSLLTGEVFSDAYNTGDGFYAPVMDRVLARSETVQAKVQEAELITLTVGSNDILSFAAETSGAFRILGDQPTELTAEAVAGFVAGLWQGYSNFCQYVPMLLDRIRELNDHADVVLVGVFDPMRDATLLNETVLPIGTALTAITSLINEKYRAWAAEKEIIYADISDCDTWFNGYEDGPASVLDGMDDIMLYVHPTAEGYAYIGRQIVKALEAKNSEPDAVIRLDLQSFKANSVTSVLVNGSNVSNFKVIDTYTIEIPCPAKQSVTVTVIAKEGRTYKTAMWYARWICGTGYQATAITKTNDVVGSGVKAATRIAGTVSAAARSVLSLFKK